MQTPLCDRSHARWFLFCTEAHQFVRTAARGARWYCRRFGGGWQSGDIRACRGAAPLRPSAFCLPAHESASTAGSLPLVDLVTPTVFGGRPLALALPLSSSLLPAWLLEARKAIAAGWYCDLAAVLLRGVADAPVPLAAPPALLLRASRQPVLLLLVLPLPLFLPLLLLLLLLHKVCALWVVHLLVRRHQVPPLADRPATDLGLTVPARL